MIIARVDSGYDSNIGSPVHYITVIMYYIGSIIVILYMWRAYVSTYAQCGVCTVQMNNFIGDKCIWLHLFLNHHTI